VAGSARARAAARGAADRDEIEEEVRSYELVRRLSAAQQPSTCMAQQGGAKAGMRIASRARRCRSIITDIS
jgi:hypothetical protein